jgi:5-methyltetrahydropteroyltriglutamate--homocysteine methyltransferase
MKRSSDRIHITHAGRLASLSTAFEDADRAKSRSQPYDAAGYPELLRTATREVIERQLQLGIDAISDGELGRLRTWPYYSRRLSGIEYRAAQAGEFGATIFKTRERQRFADYYAEADRARYAAGAPSRRDMRIVCNGPLVSKSTEDLQAELARFREILGTVNATGHDAFFPVIAPGWLDHFIFNEYYKTEEEFIYALADVMRPEYEAIVAAGFIVQIDDPGLPDSWATFIPEPPLEEYRARSLLRIEAVNHALRNIPEEQVRYHLCWGSWNGPHVDDLPFVHVADLMLKVKAQGYSFEAGNVRHEHEWKIWRDLKLPEGKILIPGVVSHRTNTIEHPEVVADRLINFANLVGRENVMAGTDCGMGGGRIHADIGWAKLEASIEGSRLATQKLWARRAA